MNKISGLEKRLSKLEEKTEDGGVKFITLTAVFPGDDPKGTVYETPDAAIQAYQQTHKANILIIDNIGSTLEIKEREGIQKPIGYCSECEEIV